MIDIRSSQQPTPRPTVTHCRFRHIAGKNGGKQVPVHAPTSGKAIQNFHVPVNQLPGNRPRLIRQGARASHPANADQDPRRPTGLQSPGAHAWSVSFAKEARGVLYFMATGGRDLLKRVAAGK
jgi:hypothetical protein